MSFLLKIVAKYLDGYKVYAIGACFMLVGVAMAIPGVVGVVGNMWSDSGLEPMELEAAQAAIKAGMEQIGIGAAMMAGRHSVAKLEKK